MLSLTLFKRKPLMGSGTLLKVTIYPSNDILLSEGDYYYNQTSNVGLGNGYGISAIYESAMDKFSYRCGSSITCAVRACRARTFQEFIRVGKATVINSKYWTRTTLYCGLHISIQKKNVNTYPFR